MIERYALWDIDNCLADDGWRAHLVDMSKVGDERYYEYNEAMLGDYVAHSREFELMRLLGYKPVFFTGRPEKFRRLTTDWITFKLNVQNPTIYMRPDGTVGLTPVELKRRMLESFLLEVPGGSIGAAFDDLPSVIKMYRAHGIPACRLVVSEEHIAKVYEDADLAHA